MVRFACVEWNTKSGGIWRPTPERPNYFCDQRREIDVNSFGCWTSALNGEHIPLHWFEDGKERPGVHEPVSFPDRIKFSMRRRLKRPLRFKNLSYVKRFDVILVCHFLERHDDLLQFLKEAKSATPEVLFLGTHGTYNLGRVREWWRDPGWYRSFAEFVNASDLFLIVNRAALGYLQLVSEKPIAYAPPFYPTEFAKSFYRPLEGKEKILYIAGKTDRLDIMASLLVARELQRRHPEFLIRLTDWGDMNLEPLRGTHYEVLPRTAWQPYLQETAKAFMILNTDIWWTNGRVALDAAAVGTPCIGCNSNGQSECFPDLAVSDIEGVRKGIALAEQLMADPLFYREIQRKAMEKVESFSYENSRRRFETLVSTLREGRTPTPEWEEGLFERVLHG